MWKDPKICRMQACSSPIVQRSAPIFLSWFSGIKCDWSMGAAKSLKREKGRHSQVLQTAQWLSQSCPVPRDSGVKKQEQLGRAAT